MVCDLWLVDFDPFCVFLCFKVRCLCRNYDWRQRKTQLWRQPLNFRVRMFVKSAVKLVEKLQVKLPLKKAHNYLYSVSVMYVYTKYISLSIGYFRVSPGLSIKTRFCTAFDMEMVVILMQIKVISTRKFVPYSTWPHLESEGFQL